MRPLKSLAGCVILCALLFGLAVSPVLADSPWGDEQGKGKPDGPPIQSVGPTYNGQPLMLDGKPWIDDPPKYGNPEFEASPTVCPNAWWL